MLDPFQLVQGSLALLAFVLAFFTLIARERKTPYTAAFIYDTLYMTLGCIVLSIFAKLAAAFPTASYPWIASEVSWYINLVAHLVLLGALVSTAVRLFRIQNRDRNLRDDQLLESFKFIRDRRRRKKKDSDKDHYDHRVGALTQDFLQALANAGLEDLKGLNSALALNRPFSSLSFLINTADRQYGREILLRCATEFLKAGGAVQFTTAIRHPADFVLPLNARWKAAQDLEASQPWDRVSARLIVVDAHTPHFGFTDSCHEEYTTRINETKVHCITAAPTFAGIHTAASKAYKQIQKFSSAADRPPTLVIYEGLHALTDLESAEQYRIFCRHVIPSEKLWGRMVTLFIESTADQISLAAIKDTVDIVVTNPVQVNATHKLEERVNELAAAVAVLSTERTTVSTEGE